MELVEASTCNTSVMMVSTVASRPDAISAGMTGLRQPAISSRKLEKISEGRFFQKGTSSATAPPPLPVIFSTSRYRSSMMAPTMI